MNKIRAAVLAVLLASMVTVSGFAQGFRYVAPEGEDAVVFPVGWSRDGSRLAYAYFSKTFMINNGSEIGLVIQDLITDEILYQDGDRWEISNAGMEGVEEYAPGTASEAWEQIYERVREMLAECGIEVMDVYGFTTKPEIDGDHVYAEIHLSDFEPAYLVVAYSDNLGSKTISSGEDDPNYDLEIAGYFINPQQTRMAVILRKTSFNLPYSDYLAIGCHLRSGFGK